MAFQILPYIPLVSNISYPAILLNAIFNVIMFVATIKLTTRITIGGYEHIGIRIHDTRRVYPTPLSIACDGDAILSHILFIG